MRSAFLLFLAIFLAASPGQTADSYRTYINARFGTVVQYPANLLVPRPESDNGDGRRFVSRDGEVELTVYASNNALDNTVSAEMARAAGDWKREGSRLTYQKSGADWFALSGFTGNDIFYEKTLFKNGVFHTLIWQYPTKMKARLDTAVNRSVRTFTVGKRVGNTITVPTRPKTAPAKPVQRRKSSRPTPTPRPSAGY